MTRLQWILTIGAVLLLVAFLVWPGWIWGHPVWGPWPKATPSGSTVQPTPAAS